MATHSSVLAWGIPWAVEPGGLHSMGRKALDTTEQPTPCMVCFYWPVSLTAMWSQITSLSLYRALLCFLISFMKA